MRSTDNDAQWLVLQERVESILAQQGIPATMLGYNNNAWGYFLMTVNPVGSVEDPRLTRMLGQF